MILNGSGFDHFISFESTRSYVCTVSLTGFVFWISEVSETRFDSEEDAFHRNELKMEYLVLNFETFYTWFG